MAKAKNPPDADWETLVNDGIEARKAADGGAWRLGELAGTVETTYGEGDLEKYAARVGVVAKTLYDYKRVATRFSERSENLTWGHHQVVAAREDAEEWLDRAEHGNWTVERLREEIKPPPAEAGPLPEGKYRVLYADPPWQYEFSETESRAIESHYTTMTLEAIVAMPVADSAHKDSVLFLWATQPKIAEALQVMEAWGFRYVSGAVWNKEVIGMGYWFRGQHELLLVGVRGKMSPPEESRRESSMITEKRGKHSKKPAIARSLIERYFPTEEVGERLELFGRGEAPKGWVFWGAEAS